MYLVECTLVIDIYFFTEEKSLFVLQKCRGAIAVKSIGFILQVSDNGCSCWYSKRYD